MTPYLHVQVKVSKVSFSYTLESVHDGDHDDIVNLSMPSLSVLTFDYVHYMYAEYHICGYLLCRKRFTDTENHQVITRLVAEVNTLDSKIPLIQVRGIDLQFPKWCV